LSQFAPAPKPKRSRVEPPVPDLQGSLSRGGALRLAAICAILVLSILAVEGVFPFQSTPASPTATPNNDGLVINASGEPPLALGQPRDKVAGAT
jgi:hypothetical protein